MAKTPKTAPPPAPPPEQVAATGPQFDLQQAAPDAKPIDTVRPPPIVADAITIDELRLRDDNTFEIVRLTPEQKRAIRGGGGRRTMPLPPKQ
jgi:hypothetical protein